MALTPLKVTFFFRIIGFMVFKSTDSDLRFQRKHWFWKICTESRDISQNVSNFAGLVWKVNFDTFLVIFFILISLKTQFLRWSRKFKLVDLNTINHMIRFFFTIIGARTILRGARVRPSRCPRGLKVNRKTVSAN